MSDDLQIALCRSEMDPECRRCGDCIELVSFGVLEGDHFICPACADGQVRGLAQILTGLNAVHEAALLDLQPHDLPMLGNVLRVLANTLDKVASGELVVRRTAGILYSPWDPDDPNGIHVDREVCEPPAAQP